MTTHIWASATWRAIMCPGSVKAERRAPREEDSREAKDGTGLHQLTQEVIEGKVKLEDIDEPGRTWVDRCAYFIFETGSGESSNVECEKKVYVLGPRGEVLVSGRVDAFRNMGQELVLWDWKFYREEMEKEESEWQMLSYLAACMQEFPKAKIAHAFVYLPILDKTYEMTLERELVEETVIQLSEAWKEANKDPTRLSPGAWCGRCRALGGCPAVGDALAKIAGEVNLERIRGPGPVPTVAVLTEKIYNEIELWSPARFRGALEFLPILKPLQDALRLMLKRALVRDSDAHPGWKLIDKRSKASGDYARLRAVAGDHLLKVELDGCSTFSVSKAQEIIARRLLAHGKFRTLTEARTYAEVLFEGLAVRDTVQEVRRVKGGA